MHLRWHLVTMELKCIPVLVLLIFPNILCLPGDPVMYFPPLELRTVDFNRSPVGFPFPSAQFQSMGQSLMPPQQHDPEDVQEPVSSEDLEPVSSELSPMRPQQTTSHKIHFPTTSSLHPGFMTKTPHGTNNHSFSLNQFVEALNQVSGHEGDNEKPEPPRSVEDAYPSASSPYAYPSYAPYPRPYPSRPYGYSYPPYSRPPHAYGAPSGYPGYSKPAYAPTALHYPSAKTLKPFAGFLEPVATKAASKVSGLLSLVLSLLGSGSGGSGLTGFKDILINGIVKPLLIAKGGIKTLISKLSIPVISLLLINLEVLITVWWLWDDCPEVHPVQPPVYHYPSKPAHTHYPY